MQIEKIKVADLKPADYNPRKKLKPGDKEFEKLKKSIEEFGYVEPIILNKRTNTVVGGHQRLEVMKHLGYEEVDCVIVDLDEQKEKALNIALNKISGEWDTELLTDLLKELDQQGVVSLTGFETEELDELFAGTEYNVSEDNYNVEEALEQIDNKPVTQNGDIWHIKQHKVLCGDSTKLDGTVPSISEIALETLTEALVPEDAKESLDTLQEISDWIQKHPGDVTEINSNILDLQTSVGSIENVLNGTKETEGLVSTVGKVYDSIFDNDVGLDHRVANIEDVLYDSVNEEGDTVQGLISIVGNLQNPEGSYVLQSVYRSEVGSISSLNFTDDNSTTIVDEINSINSRLK